MKKIMILRKIHVIMNSFVPPFFNHFSLTRAMRKKLNIFTLQLPIYYKLEWKIPIGANADNVKTK